MCSICFFFDFVIVDQLGCYRFLYERKYDFIESRVNVNHNGCPEYKTVAPKW